MKIELKILNKEFYKDPKIIKKSGWDKKTEYYDNPNLPSYATPGSCAMDLRCTEDRTIYPGERVMIPTGLAIWIGSFDDIFVHPLHLAGLILPRSGLGTKGLILANTLGLIDRDYQGELKISAWNSTPKRGEGSQIFWLKEGDRIAQLMLVPVVKAQWQIVEEFSNETERGVGGFGSTN